VQEPSSAPPGAPFPHHGDTEWIIPAGRLLDRSETAERLHVSKMTVRRLGAAGRIEEIRVGERAVRITEQSVERYIAGRRINRQAVSAA
jgi:excisionase family DNA binding protein